MRPLIPQTFSVPASAGGQPGVLEVSAAGNYFYLQSASANIQLQFDAGAVTTPTPGMQIPGSYSRLTFFNYGSSIVIVTFYVSDAPVEPGAVTVSQLANSLSNCALASQSQALVTVTTAGTPVAFVVTAGTFARTLICIPQKTVAPVSKGGTANTGTVYVGVAGTGANKQPLPLLPGVPFVFQADTGAKFDLSSFSLDADNNGDGLVIIYW
jgi:hypothetical protein